MDPAALAIIVCHKCLETPRGQAHRIAATVRNMRRPPTARLQGYRSRVGITGRGTRHGKPLQVHRGIASAFDTREMPQADPRIN
jgi:hypothetical protein